MRKKQFTYSRWWILPTVIVIAIAIAGSLVTQYIRNNIRQEITREGDASAHTVSIYVTSELNHIEYAVKSISGSPLILPVLISHGSQGIEKANEILDRYHNALHVSVVYLMDDHGMTLTSSNRNAPDSFVGKSYSFRPYFQEAIRGNPGNYFALGITSGKRGFYAGFPVKDRQGKITGVVAMKKDLDELEVFFGHYPYCFFINPSGIIFLSSKPQMVFKSLWPVDRETSASLIASQQFGNQPFEPIFQKEIADGTDVVLEGNNYLVSRKVIGRDGWSVVILNPAHPINAYIYISVMTTVSACLFVIIFSGIIHFVDRSRQIIQQSEKKFQMITSTARDAMIVIDPNGYISFWNESAERLFGYSGQEAIGQHLHNLIVPQRYHEAYEHGFSDFKTTGQGSAIGMSLELEALRRDGTEFPVELSLSTTNFGGEWIAVGIIRDITLRKQYEEEIRSLSITDQLTSLYNRRGFFTLAEKQLKIADRTKNELMFLFADLDGLKWINDNLGHAKGDEAIVETADVFKEVFRGADIIARMGGDEFAVLTVGSPVDKAGILKKRLQQQIDIHNSRKDRDYNLSISVGIASRQPGNSANIDELMALADTLMYENKNSKKSYGINADALTMSA